MLKELIDLVIPSRCAGCGARGSACCARCQEAWGRLAEVPRTPTSGLVRVFALARYRGTARRLLIQYKERGRRDLAPWLGRALADALAVLPLPPPPEAGDRQSRAQPRRAAVGTAAGTGTGRQVFAAAGDPAVIPESVAPETPDLPGHEPHRGSPGRRPEPVAGGSMGGAKNAKAGPWSSRPRETAAASTSPATAALPVTGDSRAPGRITGPSTEYRPPALCLVPAPSRRSAARLRGGPHVQRLAEHAARFLAQRGFAVQVCPALELAGGARDAVGLNRAEREANLAGKIRYRARQRPPPGVPVVLVDDVVTTGATAAACVRALAAQGIAVAAVLTLLAAG